MPITESPRSILVAGLGIAGCLLLGACGGSAANTATNVSAATTPTRISTVGTVAPTDSASAPPSVAAGPAVGGRACTLVTEQEASTALGEDPGPGSPFTSHGASQCQYGSYQKGFVLVNLTPTQGKAAYALMHTSPKMSQSGKVADVAGLGDQAFSITGPHTASIYFGMGDALVLVSVVTPARATAPLDQVLALAQTAAGRV